MIERTSDRREIRGRRAAFNRRVRNVAIEDDRRISSRRESVDRRTSMDRRLISSILQDL